MTMRPASGHPVLDEGARRILERGWFPDAWGRGRVRVQRDTSSAPYRMVISGGAGQHAVYDRGNDVSAEACAGNVRAMFVGAGHLLRSERPGVRPREARLR